MNIAHRDLKPENLLYTRKGEHFCVSEIGGNRFPFEDVSLSRADVPGPEAFVFCLAFCR